jgi:hypothetical protein
MANLMGYFSCGFMFSEMKIKEKGKMTFEEYLYSPKFLVELFWGKYSKEGLSSCFIYMVEILQKQALS